MTAPRHGALRPTVQRFVLGDFEVTTILDGAHVRDSVKPPFCTDMDDAAVAAHAQANFLPVDKLENTYTITVVNTGEALVVFDVGFGHRDPAGGRAGHLVEHMATAGYAPEDVDVVAFTHMHPDHILGVSRDGAPTFPNARYAIGRAEFDGWKSGERIPEQRRQNRAMFLEHIVPLADRTTFLEGGDAVVGGIEAVEAFGHSVGHFAYRVESGAKSVFLWGDLANHYAFSVQLPEAGVAFDDDPAAAAATRRRELDRLAGDRELVIGFHMPFPAVGFVERSGDAFRWVPASYQLRV